MPFYPHLTLGMFTGVGSIHIVDTRRPRCVPCRGRLMSNRIAILAANLSSSRYEKYRWSEASIPMTLRSLGISNSKSSMDSITAWVLVVIQSWQLCLLSRCTNGKVTKAWSERISIGSFKTICSLFQPSIVRNTRRCISSRITGFGHQR